MSEVGLTSTLLDAADKYKNNQIGKEQSPRENNLWMDIVDMRAAKGGLISNILARKLDTEGYRLRKNQMAAAMAKSQNALDLIDDYKATRESSVNAENARNQNTIARAAEYNAASGIREQTRKNEELKAILEKNALDYQQKKQAETFKFEDQKRDIAKRQIEEQTRLINQATANEQTRYALNIANNEFIAQASRIPSYSGMSPKNQETFLNLPSVRTAQNMYAFSQIAEKYNPNESEQNAEMLAVAAGQLGARFYKDKETGKYIIEYNGKKIDTSDREQLSAFENGVKQKVFDDLNASYKIEQGLRSSSIMPYELSKMTKEATAVSADSPATAEANAKMFLNSMPPKERLYFGIRSGMDMFNQKMGAGDQQGALEVIQQVVPLIEGVQGQDGSKSGGLGLKIIPPADGNMNNIMGYKVLDPSNPDKAPMSFLEFYENVKMNDMATPKWSALVEQAKQQKEAEQAKAQQAANRTTKNRETSFYEAAKRGAELQGINASQDPQENADYYNDEEQKYNKRQEQKRVEAQLEADKKSGMSEQQIADKYFGGDVEAAKNYKPQTGEANNAEDENISIKNESIFGDKYRYLNENDKKKFDSIKAEFDKTDTDVDDLKSLEKAEEKWENKLKENGFSSEDFPFPSINRIRMLRVDDLEKQRSVLIKRRQELIKENRGKDIVVNPYIVNPPNDWFGLGKKFIRSIGGEEGKKKFDMEKEFYDLGLKINDIDKSLTHYKNKLAENGIEVNLERRW